MLPTRLHASVQGGLAHKEAHLEPYSKPVSLVWSESRIGHAGREVQERPPRFKHAHRSTNAAGHRCLGGSYRGTSPIRNRHHP